MTTTMNPNGRVRKSLAEQIDRLDGILDGLADGLNEAVANAVQQAVALAVKEAVKAVLTEILGNAAVMDKLRSMADSSANPEPEPVVAETPLPRAEGRMKRAWQWTRGQVRRAGQALAGAVGRLRVVRRFKVELVTALAAGAAMGVAAYYAGPWLSAALSGVGAFAATLGLHAGLWLRHTLGTLTAGRA
jgi:hypothetical protein